MIDLRGFDPPSRVWPDPRIMAREISAASDSPFVHGCAQAMAEFSPHSQALRQMYVLMVEQGQQPMTAAEWAAWRR